MAKELLALRLNSIHNLHYFLDLMAQVRRAVEEQRYGAFLRDFLSRHGRARVESV